MAKQTPKEAVSGALSVRAYPGDGAVLLAFDIQPRPEPTFCGFAVRCRPPDGRVYTLKNRLAFDSDITSTTQPAERKWTDSTSAPFQKFCWIDFPPAVEGPHVYTVTAMHLVGGKLVARETTDVTVDVGVFEAGAFRMAFTRGYISSQAYADEFQNEPIRPTGAKSITYDTKPFEKQYAWLGAHGRKLLFDMLDECVRDERTTVDVLAYDLDEPDVLRAFQKLGRRLRAVLDDAPLHTKPGAAEIDAHKALVKSAGADNVRQGHFKRFAHCKCIIQKRDGKPVKVLTGSMNFSVRGMYVQSNNVLVVDDPQTAELYANAFDASFDDMSGFTKSPVSQGWSDIHRTGLPSFSVAFSPHKAASVSLDVVARAIREAESSVLFAVMELGGGGDVLAQLRALKDRPIFSYGVTQSDAGLKLYKKGEANGVLVPFSYLKDKVPEPFKQEWNGGPGQVIHHKFVVVDFNGARPILFAGSSNLAEGGEESNGDNLLAIYDPAVAMAYAVEAIRLVDHYHFRVAMQQSTDAKPLQLQRNGNAPRWWAPYYDETTVKWRERRLLNSHR